jgi:quaternary ammonium compound-resistance protein SugE
MAWLLVLIASAFEIAFAVSMKASFGFTRLIPSAVAVTTGIASVAILSQALRTLPVGTGYAAWTGIGAIGSVVLGIALFDESRDLPRLLSIGLIIAGLVGLRLTTNG